MRDEDVGAIPIVGGDRQLQGIIADRGLTMHTSRPGRIPPRAKVADFMTRHPQVIQPDADVRKAPHNTGGFAGGERLHQNLPRWYC
jgi:CBS-domain-containing membrane protein